MKVSELLGERYKDRVAEIESQNLMVRGGYIKQVGNGIYSLMPPARRIHNKIEAILRQEMDRIDGQEVLFPVTMPATLWQASGRWESVGKELLRFKDRSGADMVLGMTHEEAAVHMAMNVASTYQKYPFMIYQIQTKFRDEPRARGGLIRVREFTMKDAYSFHTSQKDLERYYKRCYRAYERIYARVGIPEVVAVASDSGMMGGKVSHEFMLLTDIGEDTIVLCPECGYRANMEAAEEIGIPRDVSDIVLPLGATMHMDGSVFSAILKISFLFGFFGMPFDGIGTYVTALMIAIFSGIAMSGVAGGGFVGEMVIVSLFFPEQMGIAFPVIATIGALVDPPATCINSSGDTVASMIVARFVEGKDWFQKKQAERAEKAGA